MTIIELLSGYDKDQRIKVGSLNGFFYVGYVEDFLDRHQEISGKIYSFIHMRHVITKRQYEGLLKNSPNKKWDIAASKVSYKAAEEREKNYIPVGKRQVESVYKTENDWDGDCLIVIVTGEEMGRFWTWDDAEPGSVGVGINGGRP